MRITGSHSFFQSDNATYWPGMQNTAFLVIFVICLYRNIFVYEQENFSILVHRILQTYP